MSIFYKKDLFFINPLGEKDKDLLREHRNDYETWGSLTSVCPITPASQDAWFATLDDRKRQYFTLNKVEPISEGTACTSDKIGMVRMDEIDLFNKSVRVGIDVFKAFRGNRYSYAGWDLVLKYCFEELGMNRVWLLVLDINMIAQKVYAKIGFRQEGTMREAIYRSGSFRDYIMLSLLRKEYYDSSI